MLLLPLMRWIKGGWGWGAILYIFREAGRVGLTGRAGFESGQGTGGELSILHGQLCVLAVISVSVPPTWLPPIARSNAERTPPPPRSFPPNESTGWQVTVKMGGDHNFSSQSERISIPPTPLPWHSSGAV